MSFCYINVEIIGQRKNVIVFLNLKKITSLANEFLLYKCRNNSKMKKNIFFFKSEKNYTSPSNEFRLHRIEWKNAQVQLMSFSYMQRWIYIYLPPLLDKRYNPIITTICEPNNKHSQILQRLNTRKWGYIKVASKASMSFLKIWHHKLSSWAEYKRNL